MSGKYLLDSNILIALFANESTVKKNLEEVEHVFIPSIALGELFYGAYKSARIQENLAKVNELVSISAVLVCDAETARQ